MRLDVLARCRGLYQAIVPVQDASGPPETRETLCATGPLPMIAPAMSVESLIVIVAALLVGSIGKAITGFGLPLIAIPVMASFIGVETAVVVLVIPSTYSNVVLLREFRGSAMKLPGLWPAIAIGLIGVAIGTWLLKTLEPGILALVLAGWIGVYLLSKFADINLPASIARSPVLLSATIGIGGVCQGATGIAGPIVVTMMHAMRLERSVLVFAFSAIFLAYGMAQMVAMLALDLFTWERAVQGLVALIPVVIGLPFGLWLGRRISARVFNICVIGLLVLTGLKLAYDGTVALGL